MPVKTIILIVAMLSISIVTFANPTIKAKELAIQAISDNPKVSGTAIVELRGLGARGLQTLFETYALEIENFKKTGEITQKWQRIAQALDKVAMQKDVYASKLFWYKDLEAAKAEAGKAHKPILSLRLLGNLNEELSCANSRFFRAILYPNAQISAYLQANFILHWQSERPAPKITIDFGDGRKIERTITGNSIHYVLDQDGTVIDALSGLNSPAVFYEFLYTGINLINSDARLIKDTEVQTVPLNRFRANKHRSLTEQLNRLGQKLDLRFDTTRKAARNFEAMPPAISAMTMAVTKMVVEMPMLKDMTADATRYGEDQIRLETWKQIAKLGGKEAKLDENSISFIRRQTTGNISTEEEFTSLITKLEEYISIDTARNEFLLRPTLLVWLAKDEGRNLEKFNGKIYSELFLTPKADKWLGLYAPDIYTALDGNGIR